MGEAFRTIIKLTQNMVPNKMTSDSKILPTYGLEHLIKDLFSWVLNEPVITETMRTVKDNDSNKMDINQLNSLFRLHSIPKQNNFFRKKRERQMCGRGYYE